MPALFDKPAPADDGTAAVESDTLVALMSLTALTELHLVAAYPMVSMDAMVCIAVCALVAARSFEIAAWTVAVKPNAPCDMQRSRCRDPAALMMPQSNCIWRTDDIRSSHAIAGPACKTCICASGAIYRHSTHALLILRDLSDNWMWQ